MNLQVERLHFLIKRRVVGLVVAVTSSICDVEVLNVFYWAACAPSHKMGFRSSVSKSGLSGEGRHEGLVPRNNVLTNGFI